MNLIKSIQKGASKVKFKTIKRSPEILMIAGTISVIGGTILACRSTLKFEEILDEHNEKLDNLAQVAEEYGEEYTENDRKKDITKVYATTGLNVAKAYALPVALIGAGIASMFLAKSIVSKRYVAAITALNGVSEAFSAYRQRVKDRLGEEVDKAMLTGGEFKKKLEVVETDAEGNETINKMDTVVIDGETHDISVYARFFDPSCSQWEKNAEYNLTFLKGQERYANDVLKTRGHLFLNEVYDMIGFDHSQAGQFVGWVYDESNPDIDNYVDFGIYNMASAPNRNFVNGFEPVILLDFNVDGVIVDKI